MQQSHFCNYQELERRDGYIWWYTLSDQHDELPKAKKNGALNISVVTIAS
jgi:hypothetical protein